MICSIEISMILTKYVGLPLLINIIGLYFSAFFQVEELHGS